MIKDKDYPWDDDDNFIGGPDHPDHPDPEYDEYFDQWLRDEYPW